MYNVMVKIDLFPVVILNRKYYFKNRKSNFKFCNYLWFFSNGETITSLYALEF